MKLEEVKEIVKLLQDKGWSDIKLRTKIKESSGSFDIVATGKGLKKKNLLVIISTDIYDAQIGIILLEGVPKKYTKVIFLEEGDPFFVERPEDVKIITNVNEFPKA